MLISEMSLSALRREWKALRDELVNSREVDSGKGARLIALRNEIDRREKTPVVEVNFEGYLTD